MSQPSSQLALIGLLTATGLATGLLSAADPPAKPSAPPSLDAQLAALRRERFDLARGMYERLLRADEWQGTTKAFTASERLRDAELALSDNPGRQAEVLEQHLGRVTFLKVRLSIMFKAGRIPISDTPPEMYLLDHAQETTMFRIYKLHQLAAKPRG